MAGKETGSFSSKENKRGIDNETTSLQPPLEAWEEAGGDARRRLPFERVKAISKKVVPPKSGPKSDYHQLSMMRLIRAVEGTIPPPLKRDEEWIGEDERSRKIAEELNSDTLPIPPKPPQPKGRLKRTG